jgi:CRISPR-associated endonuclease Csn1
MAIYEGVVKGKIKRGFELVNNLDAALFYNGKSDNETIVPQSKDGLPLKCILRTGTMVLFYEKSPEEFYECTKSDLAKRLYKVTKMNKDGRVTFKFHQEARNDEALKTSYELEYGEKAPKSLTNGYSTIDFVTPYPKLLISTGSMNIIVEGYDFDLTVTGEIKFKHKF